MKRIALILAMALALTFAFSGVAYANFGPHGGYPLDTDSCAGCHRAHTSFSAVTWVDGGGNSHAALLVSNASTIRDFCYACHGDNAPGAATNVSSGVFDSGPSAALGVALGGASGSAFGRTGAGTPVEPSTAGDPDGAQSDPAVAYRTNSAFDGLLNGGGFERMPDPYQVAENYDTNDPLANQTVTFKRVTSAHDMEFDTSTDPIWGAGFAASSGTVSNFTCTSCHDPHGSSNYRILRDTLDLVSGSSNVVGGYDSTGLVPDPFVISAEQGYPNGGGVVGWLKHEAGASQMTTYYPNYTQAEYGYQPPKIVGGNPVQRSMSAWCSGCHERYNDRNDVTDGVTYNYGQYESENITPRSSTSTDALGAGGGNAVGAQARHRHPVNTTLMAGRGPGRALEAEVLTSAWLPLEARPGSPNSRGLYDYQDYMGCLTCHRAHGTSVDMTGFAEAELIEGTNAYVKWYPSRLSQPTTSGVNPNFTSALLRANNRGVCERCHNK